MRIRGKVENISDEADQDHSDLIYYQFAEHIAEQNKLRSRYFKGLELGDPVWDILLDIYVSENLDLPITLEAIAERQEKTGRPVQQVLRLSAGAGIHFYQSQSIYGVEISFIWPATRQSFRCEAG